ncbi:BLUF domain-containing protein [bacterium]|nr:BLUF domain-containing protein [bacterium]
MSTVADAAHTGASPETGTTFRLIYRSRSLLPDKADGGDEALSEILRVARSNNQSRNVTGALVLYEYKKRFAQVLEGPESKVRELFESIQRDPRHDNIEIKHASVVPEGVFRRWAMALVLEHREKDIPLVAATGGVKEASPWRVSAEQEVVLEELRDLTRGYGRAY